MIRCTKEDCDKEAQYIVHGQSLCKEHNGNKPEEKENRSMADQMAGNIGGPV